MIKHLSGVLAATALLATSACGGAGTDTSALSKSLDKGVTVTAFGGATKVDLTKKQADCVAKALADSKVSSKTLDQIAKPSADYVAPAADAKALDDQDGSLQKCLGNKTPNPLVSRPSEEELATGFTKGVKGYVFGSPNEVKVDKAKATCIAKELEASDVSNLTLTKMLDQGQDYTAPEPDVSAFKAITTKLNACATGAPTGKPNSKSGATSPSPAVSSKPAS